jgi:hypothetical protein
MTPQQTKETMEERFDETFVHAHIWNDVYNQPILYNTNFDDIKRLKDFIHQEISNAVEKVREERFSDINCKQTKEKIEELAVSKAQKEWCLKKPNIELSTVIGFEAGIEEGRRQREEEIQHYCYRAMSTRDDLTQWVNVQYLIEFLNK